MASAKGYGLVFFHPIIYRNRLVKLHQSHLLSGGFTASIYFTAPPWKLLCREVPTGHAPRLPSVETPGKLLVSMLSAGQNKSYLLGSTLAEAAAVQQDLVLRLQHPAVPCCLTCTVHAAGLQQNWQHVSAVRLQVQEVLRQVQPMQLSPIWSMVMVLASQPRGVAQPLIACHTSPNRCASCSTNTCSACAVVVQSRHMPK